LGSEVGVEKDFSKFSDSEVVAIQFSRKINFIGASSDCLLFGFGRGLKKK